MKLLFYSHSFAPNIGGIENITMSLARGMMETRGAGERATFSVTLVTQTPAWNYDDSSLPFSVLRRPSMARLWREIRSADVVHLAGPAMLPMFLSRLAGKPYVIEHHGYQAVCPNGLLVLQPSGAICPGHFQAGRYGKCVQCRAVETFSLLRSVTSVLAMIWRRGLVGRATYNVAISKHEQQRMALPNASMIYHGVEAAEAPRSVEAAGGDGRKIRFAYVGRLVPEKGLPILLQAAQILKKESGHFEILLVGDGPKRHELESQARQLGVEGLVACTGFLQGEELAVKLRGVDVVVMPSAWEETAGLAAIEQMMRGRLVIASRIGGLGEIVGNAGLTFEAGNAQELAECMREVLQNPGLVESLGRVASERAHAEFLRDRMLAEHAAVYSECAAKPKAESKSS
jgi:glycogen synthase